LGIEHYLVRFQSAFFVRPHEDLTTATKNRAQGEGVRFFVTGCSGYIGGSIAEKLRDGGHDVLGLVRSQEKARLLKQRGLTPILGTLDEAAVLTDGARQADAVINAADSDHLGAVETLVSALGRTGKLLIHTSGSSIVADDACGEYANPVVFTEDTYFEPVPLRQARVALNRYVRQAGIDEGIRTVVLCPPMVYGRGRGVQPDSDQIPKLTALSKQIGAGAYFGKGLNRWSNVHLDDLVNLYMLAIDKAPAASFFFAENGDASFKEIAELISRSLGFGGRTQSLSMDDMIRQYGEGARYGMTSNSRVSAVSARRLGWSPEGPSLAEVV
jgi:nucleoside-diphosphate-sugar epimerase